jgi:pimeloyl-ACP methyl ester carboxylesterase
MNMRAENLTIVIVPGSFSPPSMYSSIVSQFSSHGYEDFSVALPSVGRKQDASPATMHDDAAHIRSVATKFADEGKDVVIAMHSYGGIPGAESALGLVKEDRQAAGRKGGIIRLVYFAAFLVPEGRSLRDMTGQSADQVPHKVDSPFFPQIIANVLTVLGRVYVHRRPDYSSLCTSCLL